MNDFQKDFPKTYEWLNEVARPETVEAAGQLGDMVYNFKDALKTTMNKFSMHASGKPIEGAKGISAERRSEIVKMGKNIKAKEAAETAQNQEALAVGIIVAAAVLLSYSLYKRYLTEGGKKCHSVKGPDKKVCLNKVKAEGINKSIITLTQTKPRCKMSKNPKECQNKIDKKIFDQKIKLKKLQSK